MIDDELKISLLKFDILLKAHLAVRELSSGDFTIIFEGNHSEVHKTSFAKNFEAWIGAEKALHDFISKKSQPQAKE